QLRWCGMAGDRRLRHGPSAGPAQWWHRPGSLLRLRMGLRHRADGAAEVRRRGPAPVLRKRPALQPAVLMAMKLNRFVQKRPVSRTGRVVFCAKRTSRADWMTRISYEWLGEYLDTGGIS